MRAALWSIATLWVVYLAPSETFAQDFVRTRVVSGAACQYWDQRAVVFSPNEMGIEFSPDETEFAAYDAAIQSWRAVSATCSDFNVTLGPRTAKTATGYVPNDPEANENLIIAREQNCNDVVPFEHPCHEEPGSCENAFNCWDRGEFTIAITLNTYRKSDGQIRDSDIVINASPRAGGEPGYLFTTINSPPCEASGPLPPFCVSTDVQNMLTHELGHAFGLDHTDVLDSTMAANADPGETHKRVIDAGTAAGFCSVYPKAAQTPACEDLGMSSRRIVARSVGTYVPWSEGCAAAPGGTGILLLLGMYIHRRGKRPRMREGP